MIRTLAALAIVAVTAAGTYLLLDYRPRTKIEPAPVTIAPDASPRERPAPPQGPTYIEEPRPDWVYPATIFVVVFGVGFAGLVFSELRREPERAVP